MFQRVCLFQVYRFKKGGCIRFYHPPGYKRFGLIYVGVFSFCKNNIIFDFFLQKGFKYHPPYNRMILKNNRVLSMFMDNIEGRERCIDHTPIEGMNRTVNITLRYNTNIVVFTLNAPSTPINNFGS